MHKHAGTSGQCVNCVSRVMKLPAGEAALRQASFSHRPHGDDTTVPEAPLALVCGPGHV